MTHHDYIRGMVLADAIGLVSGFLICRLVSAAGLTL